MAYDKKLAERIRTLIAEIPDVSEKRMFGGIGFFVSGNMCCGVHKDDLMVHLPVDDTEEALAKPHTQAFDMTGRAMRGWVLVHLAGVATKRALSHWLKIGVDHASSLPPKRPRSTRSKQ